MSKRQELERMMFKSFILLYKASGTAEKKEARYICERIKQELERCE